MKEHLDQLPKFVKTIESIKELIITNIVLIGQIPAPTFKEKRRAQIFLERLAEFKVDECTTDGYRNAISIIRGTNQSKPPIFLVTHLDTPFDKDTDHNFSIRDTYITGAGIADNSVGLGVLISLPEIFQRLDLKFESDIVIVGSIQSIGKGNLRGIRHLLKTWNSPIRGAICIEGGELGRLDYYANGMIRAEVECNITTTNRWQQLFAPNAILMLNEVINRILKLRLPQKPRSKIVIGKIVGGYKHGEIAMKAKLGFEILSDSDTMVKSLFNDIQDIVDGISNENEADLDLRTISNISASRLKYNHPLVKSARTVINALGLKPFSEPCEDELSIFLSKKIPAVAVGLTKTEDAQQTDSKIYIEPIFTGIAQILGIILAIDKGVCDD